MNNIFFALEGYRIFDRFGFNLPKDVIPSIKIKPSFLQDYEEITFDKIVNDWVNYETGEVLTGYVPTAQLDFLLNQHINLDLT